MTTTKRPIRVLLVEDMEDDALLTLDALSQQFDVFSERIQSADALRDALARRPWDFVISDWSMPSFDALQALKIVHEVDPNMPFIIVSGTVGDDMAVTAMEVGAHDYLIKDNLTRLNAAVTRELREAVIRREHAVALEELKRRAEELYKSNRELERFAYVAAHDLQEPLRMVTSYSELLLKMLNPHLTEVKDAEQLVGFIREGVDRMERLIQGLLTYSKVVHDKDQDLQPVDLNHVIADALKHLDGSVDEAGAKIAVDPLPTVRADHTQLVQVFQNLVGNALKYRHKDRIPEIHISARPGEGCWVIVVGDNGIGIPAEHHERIFLIFKRLHRDEYPGLGIGLALTKRLVQMHGGDIWVESEPGAGSRFLFTLPEVSGEGITNV